MVPYGGSVCIVVILLCGGITGVFGSGIINA